MGENEDKKLDCLAAAFTLLVHSGVFTEEDASREIRKGYDSLLMYLNGKVAQMETEANDGIK